MNTSNIFYNCWTLPQMNGTVCIWLPHIQFEDAYINTYIKRIFGPKTCILFHSVPVIDNFLMNNLDKIILYIWKYFVVVSLASFLWVFLHSILCYQSYFISSSVRYQVLCPEYSKVPLLHPANIWQRITCVWKGHATLGHPLTHQLGFCSCVILEWN